MARRTHDATRRSPVPARHRGGTARASMASSNDMVDSAEQKETGMNVKSLVGMQVLAVDAGRVLGTVERVLFSPERRRVEGFVVGARSGDMTEDRIVMVDDVRALGHDALTVETEDLLKPTSDEIPEGLVAFDMIDKEKVITEGGDELGSVSSIDFDSETFALDFIEVSRGFLGGSSLIEAEQVISVGPDVIVVRDVQTDRDDVADDEPETETPEDQRTVPLM